MSDPIPRTYPQGVPCWVDLQAPDPDAAQKFYGALFGWTFTEAMPPGAPGSYLIASLSGADAAAIAPRGDSVGWVSYIACDDADATADAVIRSGGSVTSPPEDAGPGGRAATCADPQGAMFRLWQPRRRLGAQIVNAPGAWNFSDLHTPDATAALAFYGEVFGWRLDPDLGAGMIRLPGYGEHLASTSDPDIHERQRFAPAGFADVIAGITVDDTAGNPAAGRPASWQIRFTVADRDQSVALAERLGAHVVSNGDTPWTREARIVDPQGAELILSQFAPRG
ncbi:VOC family protein [Microbacterium rhizomatis]|uniref:VOC family protein n=1 Tax=Microbacterium rhizomatis TaxID=1631477 RepID=A0A5J5J676_9MICO|nr:VOC family protein [Microbacterium rhizomatis]KAA9111531.1 VOC family protein [Microbacterium rhizomatis]